MAAAPVRSPQRGAAPAQQRKRPDLALHQRPEKARRIHPMAVLAVSVFVMTAFGALFMQISMINRQQQLDVIRTEINTIQEQNKSLRQRESLLQAPAEILRIAESELGMVKAKEAEIVAPAKRVIGTPPADAASLSVMGGE